MLLNMDAELQHLISISMEKMTSSTGSSPTGRGSRKARGMDLRKALLVAHFLQEVRCAYFEDDHKIVANTLNSFKNECENETTIKEKQEKSKDIDNRCKEGEIQTKLCVQVGIDCASSFGLQCTRFYFHPFVAVLLQSFSCVRVWNQTYSG